MASLVQGLPETHLASFSSFFVSPTRDATATFESYMRGLFQSERANMLRMSEGNEVDHQSMQHMLTESCVDWQGFGRQIAQEANALLAGTDAVLIFDESGIDGGYGKDPALLRGIDEQGCRFADVHFDQTIYLQDPEPRVSERSGRGRQPSRRKPQSAPQRVDQWGIAQTADAWQRLTLRGAKKAYWLPITRMPAFRFEMVKKNRRAVGISWCAGKSVRITYPIIVYRMRRWIRPGKSWHECRLNDSSLNTVFARRKANGAWPTIWSAAGMPGIIIWLWRCGER